jgi:hypothetical protein
MADARSRRSDRWRGNKWLNHETDFLAAKLNLVIEGKKIVESGRAAYTLRTAKPL